MKKTLVSAVLKLKNLQAEQDQIRKEAARLEKRQSNLARTVQQFFHDLICRDPELATGLARAIEPRINPGSEIPFLEAFARSAAPEILESYLKGDESNVPIV